MSVPFESWRGAFTSPMANRTTGRRGPPFGEPEVYPQVPGHYPSKVRTRASSSPTRAAFGAGPDVEAEGPIQGSIPWAGGTLTYDGDLMGLGIFFGIATLGLIREVVQQQNRKR